MTPSEFLAEATLHQYSRREVIKRGLVLGFSIPVITMLLAACGGDDDDDEPAATDAGESPTAAQQEADDEPTATTAAQGAGTEDSSENEGATPANEEPTAAESDSGDTGSGEMTASGSIVTSLAQEPLTLENWNANSQYGHPIIRNVMEALINRNPETNELVPELALSWEQVDDVTWRFQLREGVTFHNGEEFNAEVAAYGLNYTWNPESGFLILSQMGPQISAAAVDEFTLDVSTETPDPILPSRLYFSPIPSMIQIEEDQESTIEHPIGTGPYTFVEWARGQHVRLTANPDWWGHGGVDPYGEVTIQDAEIQFRPESTVRAAQITTGEAQLTHHLTHEDCETVPVCQPITSVETLILRPDVMHPVMGDIRIRQAIAYAIDLEAAANQIFIGSTPAAQIYGPATFGFNDELEPYPYDMERAQELVEEAAADGVPIDQQILIVTTGAAAGTTEFVQYLAEQLGQIGLNAQSQILEDAQFRPGMYGTARDKVPEDRGWLALGSHGNELMDASVSIKRYYSCDLTTDSMFCNEELDPRIEEAESLVGEERREALEEIAADLYEQYAVFPIIHSTVNYGMVENLNWTPRLDGFMLLKEMSLG